MINNYVLSIRKLIAFIILAVFSSQTVLAQSLSADLQVVGKQPEVVFFDEPFIPAQWGKVDEVSGKQPKFFLIQDPHGYLSGQKNIQNILDHLSKQSGSDTLLLEGAVGKQNPDLLRFFNEHDFNRKAAQVLASESEIGGPELFLLEDRTSVASAFGIEDSDVYLQNLEVFNKVQSQRIQTDTYISDSLRQLRTRSSATLSPPLFRFFKSWLSFELLENDLPVYLDVLSRSAREHLRIDLSLPRQQLDWPMLVRYFELKKREPQLRPQIADSERTTLKAWIHETDVDPQWEDLLSNTSQDPLSPSLKEAPDLRSLWENFYLNASAKGFRYEDYPALARSEGYRILQGELDGPGLFREAEALRDRIFGALTSDNVEQRGIIDTAKHLLLLRKLFRIELTPEEFKNLMKDPDENVGGMQQAPHEIAECYRNALKFYQLAKQRDVVMLQQMIKYSATSSKPVLVIAGGFHTPGLTEGLRRQNIPYAVISPKLTELDGNQKYIASLTGATPKIDFQNFKLRGASWTTPNRFWNGRFPEDVSNRRDEMRRQIEKAGVVAGATLAKQKHKAVTEQATTRDARVEIRASASDSDIEIAGIQLKRHVYGDIGTVPHVLVLEPLDDSTLEELFRQPVNVDYLPLGQVPLSQQNLQALVQSGPRPDCAYQFFMGFRDLQYGEIFFREAFERLRQAGQLERPRGLLLMSTNADHVNMNEAARYGFQVTDASHTATQAAFEMNIAAVLEGHYRTRENFKMEASPGVENSFEDVIQHVKQDLATRPQPAPTDAAAPPRTKLKSNPISSVSNLGLALSQILLALHMTHRTKMYEKSEAAKQSTKSLRAFPDSDMAHSLIASGRDQGPGEVIGIVGGGEVAATLAQYYNALNVKEIFYVAEPGEDDAQMQFIKKEFEATKITKVTLAELQDKCSTIIRVPGAKTQAVNPAAPKEGQLIIDPQRIKAGPQVNESFLLDSLLGKEAVIVGAGHVAESVVTMCVILGLSISLEQQDPIHHRHDAIKSVYDGLSHNLWGQRTRGVRAGPLDKILPNAYAVMVLSGAPANHFKGQLETKLLEQSPNLHVVVNTSRPYMVDDEALGEFLRRHPQSFAVLDESASTTIPSKPSPYEQLSTVLILGATTSLEPNTRRKMAHALAVNLNQLLTGQEPANAVNDVWANWLPDQPTPFELKLKQLLDPATAPQTELQWQVAFEDILRHHPEYEHQRGHRPRRMGDPGHARKPSTATARSSPAKAKPEPTGTESLLEAMRETMQVVPDMRLSQPAHPDLTVNSSEVHAMQIAENSLRGHNLPGSLHLYLNHEIPFDRMRTIFLKFCAQTYRILQTYRIDKDSPAVTPQDIESDAPAKDHETHAKANLKFFERALDFDLTPMMPHAGVVDHDLADDPLTEFTPIIPLILRKAGFVPKDLTDERLANLFTASEVPMLLEPVLRSVESYSNPIRSITVRRMGGVHPPFLVIEFSNNIPELGNRFLRLAILKEPLPDSNVPDSEVSDRFLLENFAHAIEGESGLGTFEIRNDALPATRQRCIERLQQLVRERRLLVEANYEIGREERHWRMYAEFMGRTPEEIAAIHDAVSRYHHDVQVVAERRDFIELMGSSMMQLLSTSPILLRLVSEEQASRAAMVRLRPQYGTLKSIVESEDDRAMFFKPLLQLLLAHSLGGHMLISDDAEANEYAERIKTFIDQAYKLKLYEKIVKIESELATIFQTQDDEVLRELKAIFRIEVLYGLLTEVFKDKQNTKQMMSRDHRPVLFHALMIYVNNAMGICPSVSRVGLLWRQTNLKNLLSEVAGLYQERFWSHFAAAADQHRGADMVFRLKEIASLDVLTLPARFEGELAGLGTFDIKQMSGKIGFGVKNPPSEAMLELNLRQLATGLAKLPLVKAIQLRQQQTTAMRKFYDTVLAIREHYSAGRYKQAQSLLEPYTADGSVIAEGLPLNDPARRSLNEMKTRIEREMAEVAETAAKNYQHYLQTKQWELAVTAIQNGALGKGMGKVAIRFQAGILEEGRSQLEGDLTAALLEPALSHGFADKAGLLLIRLIKLSEYATALFADPDDLRRLSLSPESIAFYETMIALRRESEQSGNAADFRLGGGERLELRMTAEVINKRKQVFTRLSALLREAKQTQQPKQVEMIIKFRSNLIAQSIAVVKEIILPELPQLAAQTERSLPKNAEIEKTLDWLAMVRDEIMRDPAKEDQTSTNTARLIRDGYVTQATLDELDSVTRVLLGKAMLGDALEGVVGLLPAPVAESPAKGKHTATEPRKKRGQRRFPIQKFKIMIDTSTFDNGDRSKIFDHFAALFRRAGFTSISHVTEPQGQAPTPFHVVFVPTTYSAEGEGKGTADYAANILQTDPRAKVFHYDEHRNVLSRLRYRKQTTADTVGPETKTVVREVYLPPQERDEHTLVNAIRDCLFIDPETIPEGTLPEETSGSRLDDEALALAHDSLPILLDKLATYLQTSIEFEQEYAAGKGKLSFLSPPDLIENDTGNSFLMFTNVSNESGLMLSIDDKIKIMVPQAGGDEPGEFEARVIESSEDRIVVSLPHNLRQQIRKANNPQSSINRLFPRGDIQKMADTLTQETPLKLIHQIQATGAADYQVAAGLGLVPTGKTKTRHPRRWVVLKDERFLNYPNQMAALERLVFGDSIDLLWGPPGTGKTTLAAEALYQNTMEVAGSRFALSQIVMTETNQATDNILLMLKEKGVKVYRLGNPSSFDTRLHDDWIYANAPKRPPDDAGTAAFKEWQRQYWRWVAQIAWEIKTGRAVIGGTITNIANNQFLKALDKWHQRRLKRQVAQLREAGDDAAANAIDVEEPFLFDYAVVEEGGTIPIAQGLVALSKVSPRGRIKVIGDHYQLGIEPPFGDFRSKLFHAGLDNQDLELFKTSFYEYLFESQRCEVFKLTDNFRMPQSLVTLSNAIYDDLIARKQVPEAVDKASLTIIDIANFTDTQDQDPAPGSYSWINALEGNLIYALLQRIGYLVDADSVGIGTPYAGQVRLLQDAVEHLIKQEHDPLGDKKTGEMLWNIGSPYRYQGRELPLMILSLVCSNPDSHTGWVTWRQLGMFTSRAQAAAVVFIDSRTFINSETPGVSEYARSMLSIAERNGSYFRLDNPKRNRRALPIRNQITAIAKRLEPVLRYIIEEQQRTGKRPNRLLGMPFDEGFDRQKHMNFETPHAYRREMRSGMAGMVTLVRSELVQWLPRIGTSSVVGSGNTITRSILRRTDRLTAVQIPPRQEMRNLEQLSLRRNRSFSAVWAMMNHFSSALVAASEALAARKGNAPWRSRFVEASEKAQNDLWAITNYPDKTWLRVEAFSRRFRQLQRMLDWANAEFMRQSKMGETRDGSRVELRQAMQATAECLTTKILRLTDSDQFDTIFPEVLASQPALGFSAQDKAHILLIYKMLFHTGGKAVLPAEVFSEWSDEAVRDYFDLILEAARQSHTMITSPIIHIAGPRSGEVKSLIVSSGHFRNDPSGAIEVSRIFKFSPQSESVEAERLKNSAVAVSFLRTPDQEDYWNGGIPAFLMDSHALKKMTPAEQLKYVHRMTQLQLLAAEYLKQLIGESRTTRLHNQIATFLNLLQIDFETSPEGFVRPSAMSLISDQVTQAMAELLTQTSA
jgi:lactate dehydrogenase-like 2-hydroxyacid dehydrogenase